MIGRILTGRELNLALRLLLGGMLLFAAWDKVASPQQFAMSVRAYEIVPFSISNVFALCLAWMEAVVGILLILGAFHSASRRGVADADGDVFRGDRDGARARDGRRLWLFRFRGRGDNGAASPRSQRVSDPWFISRDALQRRDSRGRPHIQTSRVANHISFLPMTDLTSSSVMYPIDEQNPKYTTK